MRVKMKFIDLKEKDVKELQELLKEKKSLLFENKLKLKTMQLTDPSQIKKVRREIARINTAIKVKKD